MVLISAFLALTHFPKKAVNTPNNRKTITSNGGYNAGSSLKETEQSEIQGTLTDTTKNTLSVPFNDEEALTELIEKEGENIACIIMEVVM